MNAQVNVVRKPSMERAFREALVDPSVKAKVRDALGWDESQVSRFLSGQMGLTIDKIDAAIKVLSLVVSSERYMDYLAYGSQIGAACHCARAGMGECGPGR
ncbi:DNA-binding protein [Pigmentiphaga litoralis]|jgi:predicted methyltransferase MtxX (methanogen marker protein 4)|uniref:DNA-binding protein n=1 Tax=Pigmentiphaga litoralis TaxID=516702 RepID=UPI001674FDF8|nr:DNA-binding protein [Pigmentiphaga litoralis]GGX11301.1 DNA-binding protein [Pigmentiphaga litoralis]